MAPLLWICMSVIEEMIIRWTHISRLCSPVVLFSNGEKLSKLSMILCAWLPSSVCVKENLWINSNNLGHAIKPVCFNEKLNELIETERTTIQIHSQKDNTDYNWSTWPIVQISYAEALVIFEIRNVIKPVCVCVQNKKGTEEEEEKKKKKERSDRNWNK